MTRVERFLSDRIYRIHRMEKIKKSSHLSARFVFAARFAQDAENAEGVFPDTGKTILF